MKRCLSTVITLAMIMAMTVIIVPTASAAWDGSSVAAALIGSGTEADPYLITNENDLAFVAKQVNDAVTGFEGEYFKLTVDLDLGNKLWTPIGVAKNYFRGHFDGDGHTITNLYVKTDPENSSATHGGLFGRIADGTVKNLTIDGAKVTGLKYAGVVAGLLSCTAGTGSASIVNCRVVNAEVYGTQPGGIVGRSATTKATKGQLHITGCSAENLYIGQVSAEDYPKAEFKNHYIGGIVGCAGATIIEGCYVKNFTADVCGTSFAPAGGIVGCQGASSVATDVYNCYVVGVTFKASADSAPEKTNLGGLIGKAAHVEVASGDPNTECNVFNCFVSDVSITNATTSVSNGVVAGLVNDIILFNDIYYVAVDGLGAYGYYNYDPEPIFTSINALADLSVEKLNKGNSTVVWIANPAAGHPTIELDAVLTNAPNFVDYYVENPEVEETTEAPEETTEAPKTEETTEAPKTEETTDAPKADDTTKVTEQTNAPAQTDKAEEKGCGGMIAGGVMVVALLGTAVVFKKRK